MFGFRMDAAPSLPRSMSGHPMEPVVKPWRQAAALSPAGAGSQRGGLVFVALFLLAVLASATATLFELRGRERKGGPNMSKIAAGAVSTIASVDSAIAANVATPLLG